MSIYAVLSQTKKNGRRLNNRRPFFLSHLFFLHLILFFFLLSFSHADATESELLISNVVKVDPFKKLKFATPELSLRLIDEYQAAEETEPEAWFIWEQKRLQLMADLNYWQRVVDRISAYSDAIFLKHEVWFSLLKARALLKVSKPLNVRDNLRKLLWSDFELMPEQVATIRRLIIRSYLAENKANDAQRAMLRYQQDYGVAGEQWRLLQARVLLATKRFPQAMRLLLAEKTEALQAFKLLTRLRAGDISATSVYALAVKKASIKNSEIDINTRRQYWILAFVAAGLNNDKKAEISALEHVLVTGVADAEYDLINITSNLLWEKYLKYAGELGNRSHLLIGDDNAWFDNASNRFEKDAVAARAIFAMLGLKATTENKRQVSLEQLALLMKKLKKQSVLIEKVFLDSKYFKSNNNVPVLVRYQMLDNALARGNIKRAAELFKYLPEPPEGKKRLAWDMRRARVLVFGGQYQKAKEVLEKILINQSLNEEWFNRLMQVVFDLQKVDQHEIAIELFALLEGKSSEELLHRELKFWMAESYHALKKYERSAHLYLTSAKMITEKQSDPWAQTALYRAAESMMLAGVINDARTLYQQLLKITDSKSRQANIKQKLQQLWLLEGKQSISEE